MGSRSPEANARRKAKRALKAWTRKWIERLSIYESTLDLTEIWAYERYYGIDIARGERYHRGQEAPTQAQEAPNPSARDPENSEV